MDFTDRPHINKTRRLNASGHDRVFALHCASMVAATASFPCPLIHDRVAHGRPAREQSVCDHHAAARPIEVHDPQFPLLGQFVEHAVDEPSPVRRKGRMHLVPGRIGDLARRPALQVQQPDVPAARTVAGEGHPAPVRAERRLHIGGRIVGQLRHRLAADFLEIKVRAYRVARRAEHEPPTIRCDIHVKVGAFHAERMPLHRRGCPRMERHATAVGELPEQRQFRIRSRKQNRLAWPHGFVLRRLGLDGGFDGTFAQPGTSSRDEGPSAKCAHRHRDARPCGRSRCSAHFVQHRSWSRSHG